MKKILIVDDDSMIRRFMKIFLEDQGYEVLGEAEDGLVALEKYKLLNPDVVLLDVQMPKMNGLDVLKNIRGINPNASVIIISGSDSDKIILEAKTYGAHGFFGKPFEAETVINLLAECCT